MMKKIMLFLLLIGFYTSGTHAQQIRLNTYGAYVFNNRINSYYDNTNYYNGEIKGGFQWGAGIELLKTKDMGFELLYLRQDSKAPITYYSSGVKFTNFDLGINHFLLSGTRYFRQKGSKVEPYGGLLAGINSNRLQNPDNGRTTNKTFFAWGFRGGANFWVTEKIALKLQAQLISDVQAVGGGFYFGTGGSGAGLSTYTTIYQFGLGGGLVFNLSK